MGPWWAQQHEIRQDKAHAQRKQAPLVEHRHLLCAPLVPVVQARWVQHADVAVRHAPARKAAYPNADPTP